MKLYLSPLSCSLAARIAIYEAGAAVELVESIPLRNWRATARTIDRSISFSVADAYLIATLNWTAVTPVDFAPWPVLGAYMQRVRARPHVARALSEERKLFMEQMARNDELDSAIARTVRGNANDARP